MKLIKIMMVSGAVLFTACQESDDSSSQNVSKESTDTNQGNSDTSKDALGASQGNSDTSKDALGASQGSSDTSKDALGASQGNSDTSKDALGASQGSSDTSKDALGASQGNSDTSKDALGASQGNSDTIKDAIGANQGNVDTAKASIDGSLWLQVHNKYRKSHQVADLSWSDEIARRAQAYAATCPSGHSSTEYGENVAYSTAKQTAHDVVKRWYDEVSKYDYSDPKFSMQTGHFTQLVWKSTTEVGCGQVSNCQGAWKDIVVCQYSPPGNYQGQFAANVLEKAS